MLSIKLCRVPSEACYTSTTGNRSVPRLSKQKNSEKFELSFLRRFCTMWKIIYSTYHCQHTAIVAYKRKYETNLAISVFCFLPIENDSFENCILYINIGKKISHYSIHKVCIVGYQNTSFVRSSIRIILW